MRSRKKKKKMLFNSVISRTFQTLYLSIYSPSPQVRTAHKGGTSIVEKGPRAKFLLSFIEVGVDQFTEKKKKPLCNSTQTQFIHTACGPRSLCTWSTCNTYALGAMATVSTATTEKLDDDDDDDDTAGGVDKHFKDEEWAELVDLWPPSFEII